GAGTGGISLAGSDGVISGNQVLAFTPGVTDLGILIASGTRNVVADNQVFGKITSASIRAASGPQIWGANGLNTDASATTDAGVDLTGTVSAYPPSAASGAWKKGAIVLNPEPNPGEPVGWVCAGATGSSSCSWTRFGKITDSDDFVTTGDAQALQ